MPDMACPNELCLLLGKLILLPGTICTAIDGSLPWVLCWMEVGVIEELLRKIVGLE